MMWTYSLNYMGPISIKWFEGNDIPFRIVNGLKEYDIWMGGRIDCYCDNELDKDYNMFGVELPLPIISCDSYKRLDDWIDDYSSDELDEKILNTFEESTGVKIVYFVNK